MTHHSAPTRGEVTQGDIDRAASFCTDGDPPVLHHMLVQAFAAHRLATIEECAKIAALRSAQHEASALPRWTVTNARKHEADAIATAIRNLGRGA